MWTLNKPDLELAKADIPRLVKSQEDLAESDMPALVELYDRYDANGGFVTAPELRGISPDKQEAISSLYPKTYESGSLYYIRKALTDRVNKCPYCSINAPDTLDHFMPQSRYKVLSVCRLNLVPMCDVCNRKKGNKSYKGFVHPYYFPVTGVPEFLIAEVTVRINRGLSVQLSVSSQVPDDQKSVLENQIKKLDLKTRISHEMNTYLCGLFQKRFHSDIALKRTLKRILKNEERTYKKNDWRTALLRGLLNCRDFNAEVANSICHRRDTAVNDGAGL